MKQLKFRLAMFALMTLSALTSCNSNTKTASLDDYDIVEVGVKENVAIERYSLVTMGFLFKGATIEINEASVYEGLNPFFFKGNNCLTKEESILFADKYSYSHYTTDELYQTSEGYFSYCKRSKSSKTKFSFKEDSIEDNKRYFAGGVSDVMEYTLTPKDPTKPTITIYGCTTPITITLVTAY